MAGQSKTGTQTVVNEPWSGAKPYYGDLYSQAATALSGKRDTSASYAGVNDTQRNALSALQNWNQTSAQPTRAAVGEGASRTAGLINDTLGGKYMDPNSNPYLRGAVDAAQRSTWENLTRVALPQINMESLANGTYGGGRQGLIMGQAIGDATERALDSANQIYAGNYATERGYQMQAPQLFSTVGNALGLEQQGYNLEGQVGDQLQAWEQQPLDAQWNGLSQMASILGSGGFGSQTSTGSVPKSQSMFQGAVGGGNLGYSLASQSGAQNPAMYAILAALAGGGLGGL